jgi:hypothetical protein
MLSTVRWTSAGVESAAHPITAAKNATIEM